MLNKISLSVGLIYFIFGFVLIKNKTNTVKIIALVYLVSYFLNIYNTNLFDYDLETSPFAAVYFSIITILILQLINSSNKLYKYKVNWNTGIKVLFLTVLFSCLIVSISRLQMAIEIFQSDKLGYLRSMYYQGEGYSESNILINYLAIISAYFRLPAILLSLSLLNSKYSRFVIYFIIIIYSPYIFSAVLSISRGMFVVVFFDVFIIYNYLKANNLKLFKKSKITKRVSLPFITVLSLILFFVYNVTASRFDNSDGNPLLEYFSHSIYFFTSSVNEFDNYFYGSYSLNYFFNFSGLNNLVLKTETGFFTYLGALFIDFGYFGGFILLFILSIFILPFNFSNQHRVSKSMLYFLVVEQFFMGVFVWGLNFGLTFLLCFIVSRILKILNN